MPTWSYQAPSEFSDEQCARLHSMLEVRTGISLLKHKAILQSGLRQRMQVIGSADVDAYFQQLITEPEDGLEWTHLVDCISVKETRFFRDPESFNAVYSYLIQLLKHKQSQYALDIWSVGCSTGEEAYSLAMIANEAIAHSKVDCLLAVRALDISDRAISIARRGKYTQQQINQIKPELLKRYVELSEENSYQMIANLRQQVSFEQGNLRFLAESPKSTMDIIFCQNVLIYFHRQRRLQVLDKLVEHIKPGGMLVVGSAEVGSWNHPQMKRGGGSSVQAYIKQKVGSYE